MPAWVHAPTTIGLGLGLGPWPWPWPWQRLRLRLRLRDVPQVATMWPVCPAHVSHSLRSLYAQH
jgi:hypothetical protein